MIEISKRDYLKPLTFWKGKKVILLRNMKNGYGKFYEGEELEIIDKRKGFTLQSKRRSKSGYILSISRVLIKDIKLKEDKTESFNFRGR